MILRINHNLMQIKIIPYKIIHNKYYFKLKKKKTRVNKRTLIKILILNEY